MVENMMEKVENAGYMTNQPPFLDWKHNFFIYCGRKHNFFIHDGRKHGGKRRNQHFLLFPPCFESYLYLPQDC